LIVEYLFSLPLGFWISLAAVAGAVWNAWNHRREGWGIPAIAVCGTVVVWYHVDVIYNGYDTFLSQFSPEAMAAAWWQVTLFAACFAVFAPLVHGKLNPASIGRQSTVMALLDDIHAIARVQPMLKQILGLVAVVWLAINVIGLMRTGFDWQGMFAPWLGRLANPWSRGRIGGGLDFLWALFGYLNIFCLAGFGIVAALARSARMRNAAIALIVVSWPLVIFDRTRNTMLAMVLPGLLCLVFFRLRGRRLAQVSVLLGGFLAVNSWFAIVMAHRSSAESIARAFEEGRVTAKKVEKHEGLNMFEELCWINTFFADGVLRPNWGRRYFADAVNAVPRTIWPGKPTIGLDYAVARGQQGRGITEERVNTTISTGMIGQGVTNFGPWGGPPAAALLISLWVALLARFDLTGHRLGRLPLYIFGLVLTFNLGRDISFLVAFPLVFGYAIIRFAEGRLPASAPRRPEWACK
jgi:hypothetical protein